MKRTFLFCLLIHSLVCSGQQQPTTNVELFGPGVERDQMNRSRQTDTIRFYKLPEDTLAYQILVWPGTEWPMRIARARTGEYRIEYRNYGQLISQDVKLNIQALSTIVLHPDRTNDYPHNTLARLRDKDTISIIYHSQGCFSGDIGKLTITKEGDQFIARTHHIYRRPGKKKKGQYEYHYEHGEVVHTITMTDQHIDAFLRFENGLRLVEGPGCTTTDWYVVKGTHWNLEAIDGGCRFNGYPVLMRALFGSYRGW